MGTPLGVTDRGSTNYTTSANRGRPIAAAIRESRLPVYKPQLPAVSSFSAYLFSVRKGKEGNVVRYLTSCYQGTGIISVT